MLARVLLLAAGTLSGVVGVADAAYCHHGPSPTAPTNPQPVTIPQPYFVSAVANGSLWEVQVDDQVIPILHLYGTPYQKGYAHGQLMQAPMTSFIGELMSYLIDRAGAQLNKSGMPLPEAEKLATILIDDGLDLTSMETQPYTGDYYGEELQGMSDASGIPVDQLRRVQMLGELTKGSCSMYGAWDEALATQEGLLTMRALDWITDGPFQNHHQLTVYHADPANPLENDFINMGWTGWIGSITGVNNHQMSIHEIGVSFPDASFGNESTVGVPFTYVLRDILQFDRTRMDGVSRLASAHRTCDLILGVGDGKDRRFNAIAYSYDQCGIMDDTNMRPVAPWHPTINHTVYFGMDWDCPTFNGVMANLLQGLWGSLTPENSISDLLPRMETGSLHAYVADLVNEQWYVTFSANDNSTSPNRLAYSRQWAQLDLKSIFAVELGQQEAKEEQSQIMLE